MRPVGLYAITLMVVLSFPAHAQQFASPPRPAQEPTRDLLPATGQTIAGPSGERNVPAGAIRILLGFSASPHSQTRIEGACVTLLNNGNGEMRLSLNGAIGNTSWPVGSAQTHALCMAGLYFARVECLGPGTCTFEWRIDRTAVTD